MSTSIFSTPRSIFACKVAELARFHVLVSAKRLATRLRDETYG